MVYSYHCETCQETFEIVSTLANYKPKVKCPSCKRLSSRDFNADGGGSLGAVRLADSEIKTVGHLADRNREKMSEDQVISLEKKHNEYKYQEPTRELPQGMEYVKRTDKPRWY